MTEKTDINYSDDISKIAKNAGIGGTGEIVVNILGYITSIVITRTVGPSVYGIFNIAYIVTWIAQVFSTAGLNQGMLRYVAYYKGKEDLSRVRGTILYGSKLAFVLSLLFAVLLFLSADYIAVNFFNSREIGFAIKILTISIPFLALNDLFLNCIQSFQMIKYQMYVSKFLQPSVRLAVLILLFLIGLKLSALLAAYVIYAVIGFILSLFYLLKIFPVHKNIHSAAYEKRKLVRFSLPLLFSQFLALITFYMDTLMLGYFRTADEVGIYSAVFRVALLVIIPITAFNTIFAPVISELFGKKDMKRVEGLFKTVTQWIFTLTLPLIPIFVLFSKPIMNIFGADFVTGATALIILGFGELINAAVGSAGYIITMAGRSGINLINSLIFCFLNITLNYIFIPRYGINGAALATGLSIIVINILRLIEVYALLRIHPYKLNYIKPCAAGLLAYLLVSQIILKVPHVSIAVMLLLSVLFVAAYAFIIFLFKVEKEDEYVLKLIYHKIIPAKKRMSDGN